MAMLYKMLHKDAAKRPTVKQIIDSDYVRSKALLLKMDLPKRECKNISRVSSFNHTSCNLQS